MPLESKDDYSLVFQKPPLYNVKHKRTLEASITSYNLYIGGENWICVYICLQYVFGQGKHNRIFGSVCHVNVHNY
jgi:hypothetical protein